VTTALVRTRTATLDDVAAVVALHERCAPETLRRRFHVPVLHVPARVARTLVEPPGGWSVVAEQGGAVVGLGCAGPVGAEDPGAVEVGLLVEDLSQGTGVGSRMLHDLAREAASRGFRRLVCVAEPDNCSVLPTVRRAGLVAEPALVDGLLEVVVPLDTRSPALPGDLPRPA
jgi:L-amino acid N-acyltransferase YncA